MKEPKSPGKTVVQQQRTISHMTPAENWYREPAKQETKMRYFREMRPVSPSEIRKR